MLSPIRVEARGCDDETTHDWSHGFRYEIRLIYWRRVADLVGQISNIIYAGLLRLFGPGVSSFAREFGLGETVTMKGMKAVLYPIWRIDAIFEGDVESERTRREKEAFLAIEEGYVPGE